MPKNSATYYRCTAFSGVAATVNDTFGLIPKQKEADEISRLVLSTRPEDEHMPKLSINADEKTESATTTIQCLDGY